jgi:predicted nucleic acid-binding protein
VGVTPRRRELIVADTTFMSVWRTSPSASSATRRWPEPTIRRIAAATLSISVVTVAELRAGHLNARWGPRRRRDEEIWLRQFELHGVDRSTAEAWAELKDATRRQGRTSSDNDLWIAATGLASGAPVLTCDADFLPMRSTGLEVIYLPRHARRAGRCG